MEHLSFEILDSYQSGKLAGSQLLSVDDHLAECEICRLRLSSRAGEQASHLTYAELQAYVDRAMPPDQVARLDQHFLVCAQCREDADDLKNWVSELSRHSPARNNFRRAVTYGALAATLLVASIAAWRTQIRPPLAISLHDGGSVVGLDRAGHLRASASLSSSDRSLMTSLLQGGILKVQIDPDILGRQSNLLGDEAPGSRFQLLSPVGYSVEETTPQLRWQALPNATSYQVTIFDSNYNLVETSPVLEKKEWVATAPLKRDKIYAWQVVASTNHEKIVAPRAPDAEARFHVISAAEAGAIDRLRLRSSGDHLLLAARFAALGLCQDTLIELEALQMENPNSQLAARIQASAKPSCPVRLP